MSITKDSPHIKSEDNPHKKLLIKNKYGHYEGQNPLYIDIELLEDAGHVSMPKAKAIRKKCLDCCHYQPAEVRKCVATDCPLYPFRMGKDPHIAAKRKNNKSTSILSNEGALS